MLNVQLSSSTSSFLSASGKVLTLDNNNDKEHLTFPEMWYQIFLWALLSSVFVHTIAAGICFATLRKHKYGKFFPILILTMGFLLPLTSGVLTSAAVAFVYHASKYQMPPLYALFWGIGQTVVAACIGFTRILATL